MTTITCIMICLIAVEISQIFIGFQIFKFNDFVTQRFAKLEAYIEVEQKILIEIATQEQLDNVYNKLQNNKSTH